MTYYEKDCFKISELQKKIVEFYPFTIIETETITRKDNKYRLNLSLKNPKTAAHKNISLVLSVKYGETDGKKDYTLPREYFINIKSFDSAVEAYKSIVAMQNDILKEIKPISEEFEDT